MPATPIQAPARIDAGQTLEVSFTVENRAEVPAGAFWDDRVVLSSDDVLGNADDVVIGTVRQTENLAIGARYTETVSTDLSILQAGGTYTIFLSVDFGDRVDELDEDNNVASSLLVIETVGIPDLVVDSVTTAAEGFNGEALEVTWTVRNAGAGVTTNN